MKIRNVTRVYFINNEQRIIEEVNDLPIIPRIGEEIWVESVIPEENRLYKIVRVMYVREEGEWVVDIGLEE